MWTWTKQGRKPKEENEAMNDHRPMSDDFVFYAASIAQAAAAVAETERTLEEQQTPAEGIPTPGPDALHIYIVDEPVQEPDTSGPVVESTIAPSSDPAVHPTTGDPDTPAEENLPPLPTATPPLRKRLVLWIGIGASATLVMLAALLVLSPLMFALPVTVTIVPVEFPLATTMQVSVSTGSPPSPGSLTGRALPMLSLTESLTVPTTGVGHQQAEPGHGTVTFYNAAPSVQVIPAGTLLTGKDGTQVVTDAEAVIPAGTLATNGQVTVPAHTVNVGSSGNIAARDLYGACCREGVYVQNTVAFTGGQNARTFPMVTAQDVAKVEGMLHPQLIQSIKAAFITDLASGESLVTPFACREDVEGSAGIGQEATSLTLMLTDTCTAVAYHTAELTTLVAQQLMAHAQRQLGTGYTLMGSITPLILNAIPAPGKTNTLLLTVKGTGTWAYQFDEEQMQQMAKAVAGKNTEQATSILLHLPGVSQVELGTSGTLPADPARIHVLVVEQGS